MRPERRVAIVTLGCKVNAYDSAAIADRLRAEGCMVVPPETSADVVVVNSCTVTDAADAESRRLARRARRLNPHARVILTGCYAQTRPEEAAALDALARAVAGAPVPRTVVGPSRRERAISTVGARRFAGQTRAFLKVQEGCDLFCTFCIVPMARGASRSLPPRVVLAEVAALAAEGFEEVVLTGVHLGGYGHDLDPPVDLAWLVAAIAEQALVPRLRLSSIDPHEVSELLLRVMADAPTVCHHLHVPLQSADDGVLTRMRRRYVRTPVASDPRMVSGTARPANRRSKWPARRRTVGRSKRSVEYSRAPASDPRYSRHSQLRSSLAVRLNSSAARWGAVPWPGDAKLTLPGLA